MKLETGAVILSTAVRPLCRDMAFWPHSSWGRQRWLSLHDGLGSHWDSPHCR